MNPSVRAPGAHAYEGAIDDLWGSLARTLSRLEAIAGQPPSVLAEQPALDSLRRLQYGLHQASEVVLGLDPPPGAEEAHAELACALADARDLTADFCDVAAAEGEPAAGAIVYEWRGALFRVRLARMRLLTPRDHDHVEEGERRPAPWIALAAVLLLVAGALAFVAGAWLELWPLVAAGAAATAGGSLLSWASWTSRP